MRLRDHAVQRKIGERAGGGRRGLLGGDGQQVDRAAQGQQRQRAAQRVRRLVAAVPGDADAIERERQRPVLGHHQHRGARGEGEIAAQPRPARQHDDIGQPRRGDERVDRLLLAAQHDERHVLAGELRAQLARLRVVGLERLADRVGHDLAAGHRIERDVARDRGVDQHADAALAGAGQRQGGLQPRGHARRPVRVDEYGAHPRSPPQGNARARIVLPKRGRIQ